MIDDDDDRGFGPGSRRTGERTDRGQRVNGGGIPRRALPAPTDFRTRGDRRARSRERRDEIIFFGIGVNRVLPNVQYSENLQHFFLHETQLFTAFKMYTNYYGPVAFFQFLEGGGQNV